MGRTPSIMIIDPDLAKQVLITNFKNFHDNTLLVRVSLFQYYQYKRCVHISIFIYSFNGRSIKKRIHCWVEIHFSWRVTSGKKRGARLHQLLQIFVQVFTTYWKNQNEINVCVYVPQLKNMYPIMEHVSKSMTTYLKTLLKSKPNGVDLKDVSNHIPTSISN